MVNATPRPLYPGNDPVPIVQEARWVPGPVRMGAENLAHQRDSIPGPSSPTELSRPTTCDVKTITLSGVLYGHDARSQSTAQRDCGTKYLVP